MSSDTNPFLNPEWLEIQRRCLEELGGGPGTGDNSRAGAGDETRWQQAMQAWMQSVLSSLPGDARSLFDNILRQSQAYYAVNQQFARMFEELASSSRKDEDWEKLLDEHIARMKARLEDRDDDESLRALLGGDPQDVFRAFTAVPPLGPFRENQARIQECLRCWQDCEEKARAFRMVFQDLGVDALERLQQKILKLGRANEKITSLRQLYDLWVDSNEEVFSRYAASEEYARTYAELIASLMAFRRQGRALLDDVLRQLDMPSRETVREMRRRQHEYHEALRLNAEGQQQLRAEVEKLRNEIEGLRREQAGGKGNRQSRKPANKGGKTRSG